MASHILKYRPLKQTTTQQNNSVKANKNARQNLEDTASQFQ